MGLRKNVSEQKLNEYCTIEMMRKRYKLQPITTGTRVCLTCDKKFFSHDLVNQKCCSNCRRDEDYQLRIATSLVR